ncbi:MAG TPA: hypothetical protein VGB37_15130 [Candidatus Lokiarchaeia archaeon]
METEKEELKKQIEERNKITQKLRKRLWKIEDEEYLKKVKKVLGNFYFKTYGRGKNKDYSFVKLIGINKKRIEVTEISVSKKERYGLSELTSGKRLTKIELLKKIKEILEDE